MCPCRARTSGAQIRPIRPTYPQKNQKSNRISPVKSRPNSTAMLAKNSSWLFVAWSFTALFEYRKLCEVYWFVLFTFSFVSLILVSSLYFLMWQFGKMWSHFCMESIPQSGKYKILYKLWSSLFRPTLWKGSLPIIISWLLLLDKKNVSTAQAKPLLAVNSTSTHASHGGCLGPNAAKIW